jgi:uncharacterized protein (DUF924 family)
MSDAAGNSVSATVRDDEPAWVGEVLRFWFESLGPERWFAKNDEIDQAIRERFRDVHGRLLEVDAAVPDAARPLLAAVIVLDQFSRNMFRGSPRAFAADPLARRLADRAIALGLDRGMRRAERLFLYLPFEHSEDRGDQVRSVELIAELGNDGWTRYAEAHKLLIDRFGRFPHRNAVLGRTSTPEEIAAMQDPMGSF